MQIFVVSGCLVLFLVVSFGDLIVVVFQFDCGIHPAYSGMAALPYFDEIDPSTVDVLLITQYVTPFFRDMLQKTVSTCLTFGGLDISLTIQFPVDKQNFKDNSFKYCIIVSNSHL